MGPPYSINFCWICSVSGMLIVSDGVFIFIFIFIFIIIVIFIFIRKYWNSVMVVCFYLAWMFVISAEDD